MSRFAKDLLVLGMGGLAVLYLIYPAVLPDFIPDIIPIVGQIDDSTAVAVLLGTLRYYGLDVTALFNRREKQKALPEQ